jgi:hypothetical protein
MNDLKPGPLVALGGAVVLLISTFLPWLDVFGFTENGLNSDFFGLIGVLVLIMAVVVGVIAALQAFAPQVGLPDRIVGYTQTQLIMVLGTASFLTTFGLQFRSSTGIGILIAWIGAALIIVGAVLQMREGAASPPPAAPPPPGGGGGQPGTF